MSLEAVTTLSGHSAACWGVCFHPSRPIIASCSSDKSIRIYSFNKALQSSVFQHLTTLPSAHNRTIRQVVFSPDGKRLASASFDSTVGIWERISKVAGEDSDDDGEGGQGNDEEWENVGSLEGHESEVKAVAWSHDGGLLATCGRDKSVWIWDANTPDEDFECLAVLMDHSQDVKHVTFSPTEEILASSSYDDSIKLYASDYTSDEWMVSHSLPPAPPKHYHFPNAADPGPDESGTGHSSTVWCSSFSPCGNYIASCSDDLTIRIWARYKKQNAGEPGGAFRVGRTEKEGWYCASTLRGYHERTIFSIDWTEAGNWTPEGLQDGEVLLGRIVSVGGDGKICVIGVSARPAGEEKRNGFTVHHALLATMEQGHGVHDINNVQWCRLGKASTASVVQKKDTTNRWRPPPTAQDEDEDDIMGQDDSLPQDQQELWKEARNMLATAGDDGDVKIWKFLPSTKGLPASEQQNKKANGDGDDAMQVQEP